MLMVKPMVNTGKLAEIGDCRSRQKSRKNINPMVNKIM